MKEIHIRLDEEIYKNLVWEAALDERSLNKYIIRKLTKGMELHQLPNEKSSAETVTYAPPEW